MRYAHGKEYVRRLGIEVRNGGAEINYVAVGRNGCKMGRDKKK